MRERWKEGGRKGEDGMWIGGEADASLAAPRAVARDTGTGESVCVCVCERVCVYVRESACNRDTVFVCEREREGGREGEDEVWMGGKADTQLMCEEASTPGPSNLNQNSILNILITSGDKCPQNGSKYGSMAPSTGLG